MTAGRCRVWAAKPLVELGSELGLDLFRVFDLGQLLAVEDVDCPFCPEHCNLGRGPSIDQVGANVFAAHHDVRPPVGLAGNHADLGHCCLRIGVYYLGSMADDATVLLHRTRHKARAIHKGYQRDIERIAKTHLAGDLIRGVDVKHSGKPGRLIGDHAHHLSMEPGKANDRVARKAGMDFEKAVEVKDARDSIPDIIGLGVL